MMKSKLLILFILLFFPCNPRAQSINHYSITESFNFIERLSPEGCQIYIGEVKAIKKPWRADHGEVSVEIDIDKYLVGGGKIPSKKQTIKGRYPDFSIGASFIIVNSPPDEVLAIIPLGKNTDIMDKIMAKVKKEFKKRIIISKVQSMIFDRLKAEWSDCRIYQKDRPFLREYYGTKYYSTHGTVQFINGSIFSQKEPSIIFNKFVIQNEKDEKITVTGLIMPSRQNFEVKLNYKEGGYVEIEGHNFLDQSQ